MIRASTDALPHVYAAKVGQRLEALVHHVSEIVDGSGGWPR
jgi:hypothetical protein